ncbi:peptide chain release factor 2 [Patescibacteria group bacterium]|nr:peptide chain release factor 2 [Patescibacteria group bacterium]
MSHLNDRLQVLHERLTGAWDALQLDEKRARVVELQGVMNESDFWQDQNRARAVSQESSDLVSELGAWDGLHRELDDLRDLVRLAEEERDDVVKMEAEEALLKLEERFSVMEFQMLLAGEFDSRNAIVSLHAGAGGTDANDWVAMLLRMYTRFAERHGFSVELLDESRGEEAGFKSVTFGVRGRYAYGWLRSEHGVHRLVRISPFDAEQMRHTTFALAEVLPEFAEVDQKAIEIDPEDLRIDTFMASGKGGQSVNTTYSAVRITHIPTGISVSCQNERSQSQNKDTAMKVLQSKLYRLMVEARAEKLSDVKGEHKTAAWGNQIRSYVLHPYKMVKDHRTDIETTDTEAVLGGDLDAFCEAYLRKEVKGAGR